MAPLLGRAKRRRLRFRAGLNKWLRSGLQIKSLEVLRWTVAPAEESGPLSEKVFSERGFSDYGAMERCEGLRQSRRDPDESSPVRSAGLAFFWKALHSARTIERFSLWVHFERSSIALAGRVVLSRLNPALRTRLLLLVPKDYSPLPQAPNAIPIPQLAPLLDLPITSHQSLTT